MDERVIVWKTFGQTVIHPVTLALTIVAAIALLTTRRERAAMPLVFIACFLPIEQRIVVAGLDFDMIRLMILVGGVRLLARGEAKALRPLNRVDWAFVAWMVSGSVFYVLRELDFASVIYRCGVMFDAFGIYFLFRALVRDEDDARHIVWALAWMTVVTGALMSVEKLTGRNYFSLLGGVEPFSIVRDGMIRAQGAFEHPIMAGTFGATTFPLIIGLALDKKSWTTVVAGLIGSVLVTFMASSSGAVIGLGAGIVGLMLWPLREEMRKVRWSIAAILLVLHVVRERPVWQLIGRLSDLMGGDGYHRVALIDGFVHNWKTWIVRGTDSTGAWGWGLQDLTNQFVFEGVQGGLVTLVIFVVLISYCYANVARGRTLARRRAGVPRRVRESEELFAWCMGASFAAHMMVWISVSYFGSLELLLYMLIAMISSLTSPAFWTAKATRPVRVRSAAAVPVPAAEPAPAAEWEPDLPAPAGPSLGKGLLRRRRT